MDKKLFAELKVGDKVLVRDDLQVGADYGEDSFASHMEHFLGKVGTVARIRTHGILLEEVECFNWTPEMLVGKVITGEQQEDSVETEKAPHKFAVGDTVKLKNSYEQIWGSGDEGTTGTVVKLEAWTGSTHTKAGYPLYTLEREDGMCQCAAEPQIEAVENTEDTKKTHKFAVGQKVRVTANGHSEEEDLVWCCWSVGKEVTVARLSGFCENGESEYVCEDEQGQLQYMPESQLESADYSGKHLDIEVGKVYTALTNLGITWVIKVEDIDSNKVYHKAALCCNDDYFAEGGWFLIDNMIEIEEATAEQEEQLLRAKVDAGVMSADELPFNNPERESGKVYIDVNGWIFRHMKGTGRERLYDGHAGSVGTVLTQDGAFFDDIKAGSNYIPCDWRIATAAEQKKLEAAEKEHGCDYSNAFVNKKGTVIHVDGYYVWESEGSMPSVITKIAEITESHINMLLEVQLDGQWVDDSQCALKEGMYVNDLRLATPAEINLYEKAVELKEAVGAVKSE